MRRPRFVLRRSDAGWSFVLRAPNEETILVSELYETREGAVTGIAAVKRYALAARIVQD